MADEYFDFEFEQDPDELAHEAFTYLEEQVEGWQANAANLDTMMIEIFARMVAVVATLATVVPSAIFRTFGERIMRVPPEAPSTAQAQTVWTMADSLGHTVPAGAAVTIGGESFELQESFTVPEGQTVSGVITMYAIDEGAQGSGLTGPVGLIDLYSFVSSVTLQEPTSGGSDGQDDEEYMDSLASEAETLSKVPILPRDFEILAKSVDTVDRALVIDNYNPGVNEVQQLAVTNATGGTFTLTFNGQVTAGIAYNASATTVQAELEALSNINPGDISVTGGPLDIGPVSVEFIGQYVATDVAQMTTNVAALVGAGAAATVTTTVVGVVATTGNERMVAVYAIDSAGVQVDGGTKNSIRQLLEGLREVNFVVHLANPTFTQVTVSFTIKAYSGQNASELRGRAEQAVRDYLSPVNWGQPIFAERRVWVETNVVRFGEIYASLNTVEGVDYVESVTINGLVDTDVAMNGRAALPSVGTITGTVT